VHIHHKTGRRKTKVLKKKTTEGKKTDMSGLGAVKTTKKEEEEKNQNARKSAGETKNVRRFLLHLLSRFLIGL
jgi:hypothetical protein